MNEESYIIRIYRKDALPASMRRAEGGRRDYDRMAVTGIVEVVEREEKRAFHNIDELWGILSGARLGDTDATKQNLKT